MLSLMGSTGSRKIDADCLSSMASRSMVNNSFELWWIYFPDMNFYSIKFGSVSGWDLCLVEELEGTD